MLGATTAAFSQTAGKSSPPKPKAEQQPWQRKPYDLADEIDENKFRQNLLKVMMSLAQSGLRRYQAETGLFPQFAPSDLNDPIGVHDALRGSTLLELHEQGAIWLSLLLSSHDPALRAFQDEVITGLVKDPSLGSKQLRKQVKKYDVDKKTSTKPATDVIVQTENEFSALVADLDSTVSKTSDSKEYYERIIAKYKAYLDRQLPRVIDVSKPGVSTTFLFLNPQFGTSTPLEKDIHYTQTPQEAQEKHVITRDIRYQGMYVVRVTPLDSKGDRYHLSGFWLYLRINDPEMYVPRDPAHAANSAGVWDLHHMPPAELSEEGLVSPAAEWMEVEVRNGKLIIVKGRGAFLQRRAAKVDLAVTPIDRLQPAEGDIDFAVPGVELGSHEQEALTAEFLKSASLRRNIRNPKMFVDEMPPIPGRFQYPDTPEGQRAFEQALAKATSPFPSKPAAPHVTASSTRATSALPGSKLQSPPAPSVETLVKPEDMRLDFGKLPAAGEDWLKTSYNAPGNTQQERLQLALFWVSRFLEDAKTRNTQSTALQLLLGRLPGKIFCLNNQSIHLPQPVPGGVVLAGMKDSFDDSLPAIGADLFGAAESLVYEFSNRQPNSASERAEIAQLAQQYFASQPLEQQAPDPFLVASRTPQPTPDQWRLLTSSRVWDCPNPYHFFDQKNDADETLPVKLDDDTLARLKQEKAIVTELGLDGVFNKDKQGNYRNDQGALSPLGLLFQLTVKEPAGLLLLARAEENERVFAANALRKGNATAAATHSAKANEIAGMIEIVKNLRRTLPNAYLDLYLIKAAAEKRTAAKPDAQLPLAASGASDPAAWRSRWMQSKDSWTLIAGVRQSDIPISRATIGYLANALNEKLPAGVSILPAILLIKESIQYSSNSQYGTYATMFQDIDHR